MEIEVDTRGQQLKPHQFEDAEGYIMPVAPDSGPRRIPRGEFPTGPEVGTTLPDIVAMNTAGETVSLHDDRAGAPAVVVFTRSAVW